MMRYCVHIPVASIMDAFVEHVKQYLDYKPIYSSNESSANYITLDFTNGEFYLNKPPSDLNYTLGTMENALKFLAEYEPIIKVGKYTVERVKGGIKVGCQFVSYDQIREIAKRAVGLDKENKEDEYVLMDPANTIQAGDEIAIFCYSNRSTTCWCPAADTVIGAIFNTKFSPNSHILRRKKEITNAHTI